MKRYGEKTLREALENGAVLSIYDCPVRGPILRVKKNDENLGWITFDLYLKIRLDLEVVRKGEWIKEYTLKSIVYADLRIGALTETTETETTETETTETETVSNRKKYVATFKDGLDASVRVEFLEATDEKHARHKAQHMAGMFETVENVREVDPDDLEKVSGVTVPRFVDVMTHDEIGGTIDALKKAVAPIDDAMEADNVPLEEWQEMRAESAALWEKIGVLQYVFYIPGAQRFQTERRFYDTESGDVLTLEDLLLCWSQHKCLREGWPRFGWYVAACQTYQGGTLEEIR